MGIIISLFVGVISIGLIHRDHGKWYEYVTAVILTAVLCVGSMLI